MKNKKLTVTIGIPAHNEESNIKNMLESVMKQRGKLFILEKIIVFCDGCTDNTFKIVKQMSRKNKIINVVNDGKRIGKAARLNQIYTMNRSDLIGTFDADIVLERDCELELMVREFVKNRKVLVVAARQTPFRAESLMGRFANASFNMLQNASMRWRNGNNIHSLQGSASILRGVFAKSFKYPTNTISDQGCLYFTAVKRGRNSFRFAKNTRFIFRTVATFSDWRKLAARSLIFDKQNLAVHFGKKIISEYQMPKKYIRKAVLYILLRDPIGAVGSVLMNLFIRVFPYGSREKGSSLWEITKSSKASIKI